jgi:hypothetical protein
MQRQHALAENLNTSELVQEQYLLPCKEWPGSCKLRYIMKSKIILILVTVSDATSLEIWIADLTFLDVPISTSGKSKLLTYRMSPTAAPNGSNLVYLAN